MLCFNCFGFFNTSASASDENRESSKASQQVKEETPAEVIKFFDDYFKKYPFSRQELLDRQDKFKIGAAQEGSSKLKSHNLR